MFGLIMKFDWDGAGGTTVDVTVIDAIDALRQIVSVDTDRTDGRWGRHEVVFLQSRKVATQYGGADEIAYICARRGTDYQQALAGGGDA